MKKYFKIILMVFLMGIILHVPVFASGFHAGDDLTVKKKINSTLFAAGNNVDVSSEVEGLSFIAGNNLKLSSRQDHLFAAGNNLHLDGVSSKDAFLAGSKIEIENSEIRDLYAAAEEIIIDSSIRNAYLGASKVTINGEINGDCNISAEEIRIGKDAKITGVLRYPDKSDIHISETAEITEKSTYHAKEIDIEFGLKEFIIGKVISFVMILITGLVFLAIFGKVFHKMESFDFDLSSILKHFFIGLIALILIPICFVVMIFSIVGIPLSLVMLAIYIIAIYLSSIATAYYFGSHLLKNTIQNSYVILILSLLVLFLLELIPVVGGLISFLSLCCGLGLYISVVKKTMK